jgi:hypothetical protein
MHRPRAPSIAPGTFFVAQSWAGCITNMPGLNLRQAQVPKSKIQFSGVGEFLTYISFTQGAHDMSDGDEWLSYLHWRMFLTGTKYSK